MKCEFVNADKGKQKLKLMFSLCFPGFCWWWWCNHRPSVFVYAFQRFGNLRWQNFNMRNCL